VIANWALVGEFNLEFIPPKGALSADAARHARAAESRAAFGQFPMLRIAAQFPGKPPFALK
jgi:hypothetical protein